MTARSCSVEVRRATSAAGPDRLEYGPQARLRTGCGVAAPAAVDAHAQPSGLRSQCVAGTPVEGCAKTHLMGGLWEPFEEVNCP